MRILVCGAGATGMHVARVLSEAHHVTMIENAPEHLPSGEHAFRILLGDAADPGVLAQAEAADTDVLIAATGHDQTNLVIATLAKQLGIRWVVARMNDPEHDWLFTPEARLLPDRTATSEQTPSKHGSRPFAAGYIAAGSFGVRSTHRARGSRGHDP
jgi:Trk K+ transport system NAD-binding subunit